MSPRANKPADLAINLRTPDDNSTPNTSPIAVDLSSFGGDLGDQLGLSQLPALPQSPPTSPRLPSGPSTNFLGSFQHQVSSEQEQRAQIRSKQEETESYRPSSSSVSKIYHLKKNPGSTPELSLVGSAENVEKQSGEVDHPQPVGPRPLPSPLYSEDGTAPKRKEKTFRNPLMRTKSRRDSHSKSRTDNATKHYHDQPPKTAPLSADWPERDLANALKNKQPRGKSAERAITSESDDNDFRPAPKEKERSGFMSGARNAVKVRSGAGNIFTRLGGKITRSGSSSHEKPVTVSDNDYKCKVINLPLVQQTRLTRISKNLDSCRDKTEYWMPALPWRCIDYLNQHCESEGLYRVPGSHQDIKRWQHRFDTEHDIDLLDEEINDQNCISSTLKAWLRELPTDIMPKDVQDRLAEDLAKQNPDFARMGQPAPDILRDALSELPPFNYYLLFAITCHLSLLLSQKDRNKMDLNNLSICIQPALGIDRWLFNYLVGDWRHCWQGCYTEKKFLEHEIAHANGEVVDDSMPPSQAFAASSRTDPAYLASMSEFSRNMLRSSADDRAVSSSGSVSGASKPTSHYEDARSTTAHHEDGVGMPAAPQMLENRAPEMHKPAVAGQPDGRNDTPLRSMHTANDQNADLDPYRTRHHG